MGKSLAAVAISALVAAALTAWPPSSSTVAAGVATAKFAATSACAARGWPYNRCGPFTADGKSAIRLVTTDHLPADSDRR